MCGSREGCFVLVLQPHFWLDLCRRRGGEGPVLGAGPFISSTLRVLENVDSSPVADRLLLNAVDYAASIVLAVPVDPTQSLESLLESIEFIEP